jgi:hypothetical protein
VAFEARNACERNLRATPEMAPRTSEKLFLPAWISKKIAGGNEKKRDKSLSAMTQKIKISNHLPSKNA